MSNSSTRKSCIVPECSNTNTNAPDKLFFLVPIEPEMRKKWMKAMNRAPPGPKSSVYCCEDHFDIESDMENYVRYTLIGGRLKLRKGVVPHKFECRISKSSSHAHLINKVKISRKRPKPVEEVELENEHEEIEEESAHDEYQDDDEGPVHIIIKEEPQIEESPPPKFYAPKPKLLRSRLTRRRQPDRNLVFERKMYKRPDVFKRHEYKKKDECDSFGEYIAISLRKHDERTRSMIKQAINNILFEQEMKKYNNAGQYVVISSVDEENPLIIGDDCDK